MSGLEPLIALGLACNVLQIVDTAKKSVSIFRNILESGSVDPALDARAHDLTKICEELKSRQNVATGASCTSEQQELVALAEKTITKATELRTAIGKLLAGSSEGGLFRAVKGTVKTVWWGPKIEKLEKNMLDTQRILETRLLARICSQNDALAIKQREDFSALGDTLCTFISNYEQGKRDMESLLRKGFISVETHVTTEATKTRRDLSTRIEDLAITLRGCDIETHVTAEATQTRREISTKIEDLKVVVKDKENEDVKRLLASLRYPSMNERRNQISETHEGTFELIFGPEPDCSDSRRGCTCYRCHRKDSNRYDPVFVDWLQSPDQPLFWISGKPGAGKSTLMKFLLEDERTRRYLNQAHPDTLLISHFIWSAGDPTQRRLKGLLCSLLHQLVTGIEDAPKLLLGVSNISQLKMKEAPGDWSVKELTEALKSILKRPKTSVCILVDGLDEIDTADGPFVLLNAITQIRHIAGVKMLVSSRPELAFMRGLEDAPFLRVQDLTREGIFRYAKDRLASFVDRDRCLISGDDIHDLAHEVSARSSGVFLWASLALKSLERGFLNGDSKTYLRQRLEGLPDDLNALYKNMWDRLNEDTEIYREEAAKYLNFAILALEVMDSLHPFARKGFYPHAILHQLAHETWMANRIMEDFDTMAEQDIQSIHKGLSTFLHTITVRCAGILEINQPELGPYQMAQIGSDGSDWLVTIGFVHRSAREFLCNTAYGREILQHDRSKPQDRFCAFLKACMARDRLLASFPPPPSPFWGVPLRARYYTLLCCDPKFGLSLQEILDIMDSMENQKLFMSRNTRIFTVEKIGMLVLMGRPDAAISSLERAERLNGPVSATYLCYLLVLVMQGPWFFGSDSVDGKLSWAAMVSSLLSSGRKININTRVPVITLLGKPFCRIPKFEQECPNSPLLDIFLVESLCRTPYDASPHLLKYTLQICHLLLGLNPTLETRTLLFLNSSHGELNEEWATVNLSLASLYLRAYRSSHIVMLEVDTRYLLGLLCARLALRVRDNDRILAEKLALFETVIGDTPAWVEVVGVLPGAQVARDGGERKVIVPNKLDASGQEVQQPGRIKGLQDLRSVTQKSEDSGRTSHKLELLGCPKIEDLINSFEYGTREVEYGVFLEQFIERGLVVANREANPETWPPPRHDPLE